MSAAASAGAAAREAATEALAGLRGETPKLAIVFVSSSYPDVEEAARTVRSVVGDAQIVGGTAGACVFGGDRVSSLGVSVVLLGGDGLEVYGRVATIASPTFMEAVPVAERVARAADIAAARGFGHFACLVLAPGISVDGEALVAAVRKGAGERAQLAGALTGDDFTMDRPKVFFGDELRSDCVVIIGIFTRKPVGIAARHGWAAVGPVRTVTRAEGVHLIELDGRPALEVWLEDARCAGGDPPAERKACALYLANNYGIGVTEASAPRIAIAGEIRELVARSPFAIREDGAVQMSAALAEGKQVSVIHATHDDLLDASGAAADSALLRAGGRIAGALVFACTGRLAALGDSFPQEPAAIRRHLGAPMGGACVFGEIARNVRDADAFFNTTAVVMAFAA
ncbi:MAG TPA: FIST N-terminal domain-containing protein [Labilithrix sp.]|nr:FIST N-terminal domain-containing protein [Labilithrix sp.]